jgi:hypothetical protein
MDLGALGFWLFLAASFIGILWAGEKRRQVQHETLRQLVAKGDAIDPKVLERLLSMSDDDDDGTQPGTPGASARFLLGGGLIVGGLGAGLLVASFIYSGNLGKSALILLGLAVGLVLASLVARRATNTQVTVQDRRE